MLEVVFAVSILAIGMLGYMTLKISNKYSWVFAKELTQAVQLTGSNLERLLLAGYHDPRMAADLDTKTSSYTYTPTQYKDNFGDDLKVGDFSPSTVQWTVREGCPSELTKIVTYTTNWNVGGAKSMQVTQVQVRP